MAVIDVGSEVKDRASQFIAGYTVIDIANPANDTGVLDTFEIWLVSANTGGVKVGTFSYSSPNATNRDFENLGAVTNGSKQTFTGKNCDVSSGDLIGVYLVSNGAIERDITGYSGTYYVVSDIFGAGASSVTLVADDAISIYATGATVAAGSLPLKNVFGRPFSGVFR